MTPHSSLSALLVGVVMAPIPGAQASVPFLPFAHSTSPLSGSLFVVSTSKIRSQADIVTLTTLAGLVAREKPEIYTVGSVPGDSGDSNAFWLSQLSASQGIALNTTFLDDTPALLMHYAAAGRIKGYILFDLSHLGSTSAAITRCAAGEGVIAVGEATTAKFLANHGVPLEHDSSNETALEAYLASRKSLSRRSALFAPDDGSKAGYMAGYAVFARIPVAEFAEGGSPAASAVIDGLDPNHLTAGFGWTSHDEFEYVQRLSRNGGWAHASDWSQDLYALTNLAVHGAATPTSRQQSIRRRTSLAEAQRQGSPLPPSRARGHPRAPKGES